MCMTINRTFPRIDVVRDESVACCDVTFYAYDEMVKMTIRDDMSLDVQCDLMMHNILTDTFGFVGSDLQHVIDVARDAIIDVRPQDAL
jgi:hypothetical protein